MERRIFLAISLSILVLYAYQVFLAPPARPPGAPAGKAQASDAKAAPDASSAGVTTSPPPAPAPPAVVSETSEREITVQTAKVEAVLSNRGGRVLHWRLKGNLDGQGKPVDLVPSNLPATEPKPFSLQLDDDQMTQRVNDAIYEVTGDAGATLDATREAATVTFRFEDASGLRVSKEFRFEPNTYVVTFSAKVWQGEQTLNPWVLWGPGLGDVGAASAGGSFFTGNYVQPPEAIYHGDGKVVRTPAASVATDPHQGDFLFAGIDDHYFIASAVRAGRGTVRYSSLTLPAEGDIKHSFVSFAARFEKGLEQVQFFVGGKDFEALRAVDPQLVYAINFGMFQWLVVPLLQALKWVYGFVHNYGWAIIILTILINIIMFPLRHKSLVSMRKMQMIQPQVKAIQDRYADLKMTDPARQKMNTEIMNLYREKGANPAAGCVPMLLTMPVLLAFYSLLSQSIELRGAHFMRWIHDLS